MSYLIYRRTHPFDPNRQGVFGCQDCMGNVRNWNYQVVVGVGGFGAEPRSWGMEGRLNWVGINKREGPVHPKRGVPKYTFEYFVLLEHKGPYFAAMCPRLAERLYGTPGRASFRHFRAHELAELKKLVTWAKRKAGPTKHYVADGVPDAPPEDPSGGGNGCGDCGDDGGCPPRRVRRPRKPRIC